MHEELWCDLELEPHLGQLREGACLILGIGCGGAPKITMSSHEARPDLRSTLTTMILERLGEAREVRRVLTGSTGGGFRQTRTEVSPITLLFSYLCVCSTNKLLKSDPGQGLKS